MLEILACLGIMNVALAHHSFGEFDLNHQQTIRGSVVSFEWTNPHVRTTIDPEIGDGSHTYATFEGMSPDYLGRRGWNRSTLEAGVIVEIVYFPRKNGHPGGILLRAVLADGTTKVMVDVD